MTSDIKGLREYTDPEGSRNTIEDDTITEKQLYASEGILDGLVMTETSPQSTSIDLSVGNGVIDCGIGGYLAFELQTSDTISIPDTTNNTYSLVVYKYDSTTPDNSDVIALSGASGASTDPTLDESAGIYYLVLGRVVGTGGNIVNADITQDGETLTNNPAPEVIALQEESQLGWNKSNELWTFATADDPTYEVTVKGNLTNKYALGTRVRFEQSEPYTNDPSSGASIVLNMTDTSGFTIGNEVWVSSSAGREKATITAISAGTSITVDNLTIDHTTTNPLVTARKYGLMTLTSFSTPDTTISIYGGTDYNIANATISNVFWAPPKTSPFGFPLNRDKWTVENIQVSTTQNTPVQNTWYNIGGSLDIPIGKWELEYTTTLYSADSAAATTQQSQVTLSDANNTESDSDRTLGNFLDTVSTFLVLETPAFHSKPLNIITKTTYYLNAQTQITGIEQVNLGFGGNSTIRAISSYL